MSESKTKVYRFNNEGNISRVKISEATEVRLWKKKSKVNYPLSKEGKVVWGSSLVEGKIPS